MDPLWPPAPALSPRPRQEAARPAFVWRLGSLVEAFLYPERFFREQLDAVAASLTALWRLGLMFLIGLDSVLDGPSRRWTLAGFAAALSTRWIAALILLAYPMVLGPIRYYMGRFWYRLRLRLSGCEPDETRSSAAFAVIYLVYCVPSVPLLVLNSFFDPASAPWQWFVMSLVGWTYYLEYTSARVVFGAGRIGAMFWFVVVPAALHVAVAAGLSPTR
jgi:hypothetical protein